MFLLDIQYIYHKEGTCSQQQIPPLTHLVGWSFSLFFFFQNKNSVIKEKKKKERKRDEMSEYFKIINAKYNSTDPSEVSINLMLSQTP